MARRKWTVETIKQIVDGEKPFIQVGYTGNKPKRKNGDVWVDGKNIKWKMENGTIIRVNEQADLIRDLVKRKCSNCGFDVGMLGSKLDEKYYSKTGKCLDCAQASELEKVVDGTYQQHIKEKFLKNKLSLAKEFKQNVLESIDYLQKDDSKIEMVHANGEITTWVGSQNQKLLDEVKNDLNKVNELIVSLEEEIKKL